MQMQSFKDSIGNTVKVGDPEKKNVNEFLFSYEVIIWFTIYVHSRKSESF